MKISVSLNVTFRIPCFFISRFTIFPMGCSNTKEISRSHESKCSDIVVSQGPKPLARSGSLVSAEHSSVPLVRRLAGELRENTANHNPFNIMPDPDCNTHWASTICGPALTPYDGGRFVIDLLFPSEYPFSPPRAIFRTPVFHPNISSNGAICLDLLTPSGWSPVLTAVELLRSIQSLLGDANPTDPLNQEAAELYSRDRRAFEARARSFTHAHAMKVSDSPFMESDAYEFHQLDKNGLVLEEDKAVKLAIKQSAHPSKRSVK